MRSKPVYFSESIDQDLLNKNLDSLTINYFFLEGDVNFSLSDTKSVPCRTYVIAAEIDNKEALLTVKNCTSKLEVQKFEWTKD
jgi:hypothetical protein